MKKILAALFVAALPLAAIADGLPDAAAQQQLRDQLRSDRKSVIEHNMTFTEAEAKKFWPVYEAFNRDLQPIQSRGNRAMLDYINAGDATMTNANAKRLVEILVASEESEAKLRQSYLGKFVKAVGAKKAARYYQVESKIRAIERYDQAEAIPLVR